MYLNFLSKKNKRNFIDLCYQISIADGVFHKNEQLLINSYKNEMNLDYEISKERKISHILDSMSTSTRKERLIVLFELMALVYSDDEFTSEEKILMRDIQNKFNIDDETFSFFEKRTLEIKSIFDELNKIVTAAE